MADQDVDTLADLFKDFHPDSRSNLEFMTTLRGVIQYSPMMVAAHPSDLRAAKAAGFHTACVPRPGERGEGYDPDLLPQPDFDVNAVNFDDLAGQFVGSRRGVVMAKLDQQDQRIADIFGTEDVPDVTDETLEIYLAYLKQHIEVPCQVTGIESFEWEEYYLYEDGSEKEHERLRKTQPSCMDKYELLSFDNDMDPEDGILVNVRRIFDKKTFVLALAKLEATKRKSANRQLLDDYAIWFTTWGD